MPARPGPPPTTTQPRRGRPRRRTRGSSSTTRSARRTSCAPRRRPRCGGSRRKGGDAESAFERDAGARPWSRLFKRETPPVVLNGDGAHVEDAESPSDDLYERAKELGIRGRSKMSRDE